jgi:hypothetical protein
MQASQNKETSTDEVQTECKRKPKIKAIGLWEFSLDLNLQAALWPWYQCITEMSTREHRPGGKGGLYLWLTTLLLSCADCPKLLGSLTSWIPKDLLGFYRNSFYFIFNK